MNKMYLCVCLFIIWESGLAGLCGEPEQEGEDIREKKEILKWIQVRELD